MLDLTKKKSVWRAKYPEGSLINLQISIWYLQYVEGKNSIAFYLYVTHKISKLLYYAILV